MDVWTERDVSVYWRDLRKRAPLKKVGFKNS